MVDQDAFADLLQLVGSRDIREQHVEKTKVGRVEGTGGVGKIDSSIRLVGFFKFADGTEMEGEFDGKLIAEDAGIEIPSLIDQIETIARRVKEIKAVEAKLKVSDRAVKEVDKAYRKLERDSARQIKRLQGKVDKLEVAVGRLKSAKAPAARAKKKASRAKK